MPLLPSPEAALARWFSCGVTSLTHPVLDYALQAFFHPLGIEADWLEAEPFSALECGQAGWWLRQPRWNVRRFDRSHPATADFAFLLEPGAGPVAVDERGFISPARGGPEDDDRNWRAARHTVAAALEAEVFLHAAAGVILAGDPLAGAYASGADAAFCQEVRARLREARGE